MKSIKMFKHNSRSLAWFMPVLLSALVTGCGGDGGRDPILGIKGIVDHAPVNPTVTLVAPDNNALDVAINNTLITATFSEAMIPISGDSSFVVECNAPCVNPAGTITFDSTNTVATYTLSAALDPLTPYTVTITGAESLATGNTLETPYIWHFTTGDGTSIAVPAPTVTSVVPENDSFGVAYNNTLITATFSEAMMPISGEASFTVECFAPCVNPTGVITLNNTNTIATYTLDTALTPLTAYVVTITGAGSLATGVTLVDPYVWHFTTGAAPDSVQPTVAMTTPETIIPGPTPDAPANGTITAVFSEDMVESSITAPGAFTLTCELPCVSPVSGTVIYTIANQTASFTPDVDLDAGTTYTATIASTVTDLALNGLAGNQLPAPPAASAYIWAFTTTAALPPAYVTVDDLSIIPDANAIGVCPTRAIEATFTVPSLLRMSDTTVNSSTFTVTGPGPLFLPVTAASVELDSATGTIATFTPQDALTEGFVYTVTIKGGPTGVKDSAIVGNEMLVDYTWEFTAGPPTGECLPAIDMGLASTFGIATTAGVTNTPTAPTTTINGNVVMISTETCNAAPVDQAGGFGTCVTPDRVPIINGIVITSSYPDAFTALAVKADLNAAFLSITATDGVPAAGSMDGATPIAAPTGLGAVTGSVLVEGQNLFYPGVYRSITSIMISGDLTLDAQGDANAVFVFQSDSTTGTAAGAPGLFTRILLVNGAQASNVWWQVGSSATLGLYSEFNGNILAAFDITMETGSTSCGRLMSGAWVGGSGALVFDANIVSVPGNNCPVR